MQQATQKDKGDHRVEREGQRNAGETNRDRAANNISGRVTLNVIRMQRTANTGRKP